MCKVSAVAIGKNEGTRLHTCLRSLIGNFEHVIYVDSGSTDGSVEFAVELGVHVVKLDMTQPFTAARARNAGLAQVLKVQPQTKYVQFVDGDCELISEWVKTAIAFLESNAEYAVVCGRRRERHPEASVYNYLCDREWDTPIGDANTCGGDAVFSVAAFQEVSGFDDTVIAGEEPELCIRLRRADHKIHRLDEEMTLHDAAMTKFSQWWSRAKRSGHAYAEGAAMHGGSLERHWVKSCRRTAFWGICLPLIAIVASPLTCGVSLALLLAYPLNWMRVAFRQKSAGEKRPFAVAFFMVLSRIPEAFGMLRYYAGRITGSRSKLIEYKG